MITYYKIPKNINYVESWNDFKTWEKLNKIDPNIATVAVIDDSKYTHYTRIVVIYKGLMQLQGGSGSCYNPTKPTFINNHNPMDNSKMPTHMSKWITFNHTILLQLVISCKCTLLEKMGHKLPFYWNIKEYKNKMYGLLIGKLDLIGMNKLSINTLEISYKRDQLLLT